MKLTRRKVAFITACMIFLFTICSCGKKEQETILETDVVMYGDIKSVTTGQAAVEPYERYEIISMVSGDIVKSSFDVGDEVEEGDILYQFDTKDALKSIERQEISLEQSKNNLNNARSDYYEAKEKLSVIAPCDGIISGLSIKKGNDVSNNQQIATVENINDLEVSLPFTAEQIDRIYVGQSANVSSSVHMSVVEGTVSSISSGSNTQDNGSQTYNVTIELKNPGAFTEGLIVGGEIMGMQSPGYGTIKYAESATVKAEVSGTVMALNYSNGDFVKKGTVIATVSSDAVSQQERSLTSSELNYRSAQLSMSETRDSLDDYSITSPIKGTVITKNAKAGDTIDRTNSSTPLMVVADVSKLKFSMEIDELDISTVHEGQEVDITCEALPNEKFMGRITSISVEGTATNGVTTYTAEVVIDEPGNLRPSMNIDASIIIESAENVLIVPNEDVKRIMGVSYVFLKDETGKRGATEEDFMKAMQGGKAPMLSDGKGQKKEQKSMLPEAPEGYVIAIVETGISDDDNIEIKGGLKEFDEIKRLTSQTSSSNGMMGMMGAMHGGMAGGAMPSGNRMPSGAGMSGGMR